MNFLKLLRKKSTTRGQQFHNGEAPVKNLEELLFRSTELGGETGEVLEAVKKLARMLRGMKGGVKDVVEAKKAIEEEVGDVLISLDRLAEFFDIDIEDVAKRKFNKTSEQKGLTIKFKLNEPKHPLGKVCSSLSSFEKSLKSDSKIKFRLDNKLKTK